MVNALIINEILREKNLSMHRLEKELGFSNGTLRKAISRGGNLKEETVNKLIELFPDINEKVLNGEDGELFATRLDSSIAGRLEIAMKDFDEKPHSLAKATGIAQSTIVRILTGKTHPNDGTLLLLCSHLRIHFEWLKYGTGPSSTVYGVINEPAANSSIEERLFQYLETRNVPLHEFAVSVDIKGNHLLQLKNGEKKLSEYHINKIIETHPDLQETWLRLGKGKMLYSQTEVNNWLHNLRVSDIEIDLEVIKREENTEFRRFDGDRILIILPLIEYNLYEEYMHVYDGGADLHSYPRHAIVVPSLQLGAYRAFEMVGEGMDDGSKLSICNGDIVTGRKVNRKVVWQIAKDMNYIIHHNNGIVIARITGFRDKGDTIIYEFLNQDKSKYPDSTINIYDVVQIFEIVAINPKKTN